MLSQLKISNFKIVEELVLNLQSGMSVITGETGAGKSVLVSALNLVLGDRADRGVVLEGTERAELTATFDLQSNADAQSWLKQRDLNDSLDDGLDDSAQCIIRRILTQEGRSRAYINGQPSPMADLRELGEMLVDIHGQHEHQSLLRAEVQLQLLDQFAGHTELLGQVKSSAENWKILSETVQTLQSKVAEAEARRDFLDFQLAELQSLDMSEQEIIELDLEQKRLARASETLESGHQAFQLCSDGDDSAAASLAKAIQQLGDIPDPALAATIELLSSAQIQVEEAASDLQHYLEKLDLDSSRMGEIEQKMQQLFEMSRKHRIKPAELPRLLNDLQEERQQLESGDERLQQLNAELTTIEQQYQSAATKLTASRKKAVKKISKQVTERMQGLGMAGGDFRVQLEGLDSKAPSQRGNEKAVFEVSTNPGQSHKALGRVASGGELSRISLAIQVITADHSAISTRIFDEVDSGIGGDTADIVAERLHELGEKNQILCITHLAQVAARGDQHFKVLKQVVKGQTRVDLTELTGNEKTTEIARMLGGNAESKQALAHAEEMLGKA
ncbi:MAG: DNA repair protein RecN [Pseudomonadales bacterium]|nr:DNA repair protein RecN [Pseudomonadales bacterium]